MTETGGARAHTNRTRAPSRLQGINTARGYCVPNRADMPQLTDSVKPLTWFDVPLDPARL